MPEVKHSKRDTLESITQRGATSTTSLCVQGTRKGYFVKREDGSLAGGVFESDDAQYGLTYAGLDDDLRLTNAALLGANIFIGTKNQYIASNFALPSGYLKLSETSIPDGLGNQYFSISSQQIEQTLHEEAFADVNSFDISSGLPVEVLISSDLVNSYSDPSAIDFLFRVEERSNRTTGLNYWFDIDGVPTPTRSTIVRGGEIETEFGSESELPNVLAGEVIKLVVQATDTGLGRETFIRGDDEATSIKIKQLGFGVFKESSVDVDTTAIGVTTEPTNNGAIIYYDPIGGNITATLGSATLYSNKDFTLKRVTNGANYVKLIPATGEFIDDIDDTQALVLGLKGDNITLHSDGSNWHIVNRSTRAWGTMKRTGAADTQSITTSWTKLLLFDDDVFTTPERIESDQANSRIQIKSLEGSGDDFDIKFYASIEYSNNIDLEFCIYVGGFATDMCGIIAGRGVRFIPISFGHTINIDSISDIEVYVRADSNGTLKVETMGLEMHNVKG